MYYRSTSWLVLLTPGVLPPVWSGPFHPAWRRTVRQDRNPLQRVLEPDIAYLKAWPFFLNLALFAVIIASQNSTPKQRYYTTHNQSFWSYCTSTKTHRMDLERRASLQSERLFLRILRGMVLKRDPSPLLCLPAELALMVHGYLPPVHQECLEKALTGGFITVDKSNPLFPEFMQTLHGWGGFIVKCDLTDIRSFLECAKRYTEAAHYRLYLNKYEGSTAKPLRILIGDRTLSGLPHLILSCQDNTELQLIGRFRKRFSDLRLDLHVDNLQVFRKMDNDLRASAVTQISATVSDIAALMQHDYFGSVTKFLHECERLASVRLVGTIRLSELEKYGKPFFHLVTEIEGSLDKSQIPYLEGTIGQCHQLRSFQTTVADPSILCSCREVLNRQHRLPCWKKTVVETCGKQELDEIEHFYQTYPPGAECYPKLVIKCLLKEAWPCLLDSNAYQKTRKHLVAIWDFAEKPDNLVKLWEMRPTLYAWELSEESLHLYPFRACSTVTFGEDGRITHTLSERIDGPMIVCKTSDLRRIGKEVPTVTELLLTNIVSDSNELSHEAQQRFPFLKIIHVPETEQESDDEIL